MIAHSIVKILGDSRWVGAQLANAQVLLKKGESKDAVARRLYEGSSLSLTRSKEIVEGLKDRDLESFFEPRKKTGSAENPITKMFPAAVTERQFLDQLDQLRSDRPGLDYRDERFSGHTLVDFTLIEGSLSLPINVKNAGTRFNNASSLVGLEPDDCIPIPAYKAFDAIEKEPNLLYAICIDYSLIAKIQRGLITLFSEDEAAVWKILSNYAGAHIRDAEDKFVYSLVNRHWGVFSKQMPIPVFRIISARKSVRILQTQPKRTPGIGLRAWGTGASAEVNVHVSISSETKPWDDIQNRIMTSGLDGIIQAVNRRKTEVVFDPEI
jgi:hypothetical protein